MDDIEGRGLEAATEYNAQRQPMRASTVTIYRGGESVGPLFEARQLRARRDPDDERDMRNERRER